jgi:hypothetical protein
MRRYAKIIGGIGALVLLTALIVSVFRTKRSLLDHASLMVLLTPGDDSLHQWISDGEILSVNYDQRRNLEVRKTDVRQQTFHFHRYFNRRHDILISKLPPFLLRISPDGKWLLLFDITPPQGNRQASKHRLAYTLSVDGKEQIRFEYVKQGGYITWMEDSKGWMELTSDKRILHPLQAPANPSVVTFRSKLSVPVSMFTHELARLTIKDQILIHAGNAEAVLHDLHLHSSRSTASPIRIGFPRGCHIMEFAVSHDGRQVLWRLYSEERNREAGLKDFMRRFGVYLQDTLMEDFWVSNIDGSQMRHIGSMYRGPYKSHSDDRIHLRWSDDNKNVFFQWFENGYGGIYSVPVG